MRRKSRKNGDFPGGEMEFGNLTANNAPFLGHGSPGGSNPVAGGDIATQKEEALWQSVKALEAWPEVCLPFGGNLSWQMSEDFPVSLNTPIEEFRMALGKEAL